MIIHTFILCIINHTDIIYYIIKYINIGLKGANNRFRSTACFRSVYISLEGENVEAGADFLFLGSKITADGDCSHEIKIHLLLGRKVMINLDSILKSRDITLPTKVHLVKAMVFPVVMYGCDSWTVKKIVPKN